MSIVVVVCSLQSTTHLMPGSLMSHRLVKQSILKSSCWINFTFWLQCICHHPPAVMLCYVRHIKISATAWIWPLRNPNYEYIICGDFNLSSIRWYNEPLQFKHLDYVAPIIRENANTLQQALSYLNLHQIYAEHPQKGYSLDLLFAPPAVVRNVDIDENLLPLDQHHKSAFFQVLAPSTSQCVNFKNNYNYTKTNYVNIVNDIQETDWASLLSDPDLDCCVENFYSVLNTIIVKYVPKSSFRPSSFPVWYTTELKSLIYDKKKFRMVMNSILRS